jgi:glycosyltransferase involved in cell wall biosynthesis
MKSKNTKLRCALIFLGPFPIGNVSTLRIMSYCKALAKEGVFVKVLILAPTKEAEINENKKGNIDGVEYEYVTKITWKRKKTPSYLKYLYYIYGIFKCLTILHKNKINCLLSYHNELLSNIIYRTYTKLKRIPFILDKTEYPNGYFKFSKTKKKLEHLKLKMFDGFILITHELEKFYFEITKYEKSKYFFLPMTIDPERYNNTTTTKENKTYITVVFGTHNRDGLFQSIIAYNKYTNIKKEKPLKLILIGDYIGLCKTHPECNQILDYIIENKLEDNIEFKGLIPINEVPNILINSKCLLTTPLSYTSGGFPTKLGEYLLSGVPVVATSAGEIDLYLTNNENILLSNVGDLESIAKNLLYVDSNEIETKKIGESGKKIALNVFNAENYTKKLITYLTNFDH